MGEEGFPPPEYKKFRMARSHSSLPILLTGVTFLHPLSLHSSHSPVPVFVPVSPSLSCLSISLLSLHLSLVSPSLSCLSISLCLSVCVWMHAIRSCWMPTTRPRLFSESRSSTTESSTSAVRTRLHRSSCWSLYYWTTDSLPLRTIATPCTASCRARFCCARN